LKEDRKIYAIYRDNVNYLKLLLTEDDRVDAAVDGNNIGTPRGGHYGEVRPKLDKGALSNFLFRKKIFNYLMREQLIPIDAINADGHKPLFLSLKNIDQYFCDKTSGEGCRSQHFGSSKRDTFTLECPRRTPKNQQETYRKRCGLKSPKRRDFQPVRFRRE
jgi:hypothetical protein